MDQFHVYQRTKVMLFLLCFLVVKVSSVITSTESPLVTGSGLSSRDQLLPTGWENMCFLEKELENKLYFRCEIDTKHSGIWRLDTLRDWITSSTFQYDFHLHCSNMASVSMSWPVKALNLVGIEVDECLVKDYLANAAFGNMAKTIEDQLTRLRFIDSQVLIDLGGLLSYMMNIANMSKDFICGHEETIVDVALRNITFKFEDVNVSEILQSFNKDDVKDNMGSTRSPPSLGNTIMKVGSTFIQHNKKIKHVCDYTKLKYVDQSISSSKSRYHIDVLTENSFFGEVRVYNMSLTRMTRVNSQFREWWIDFPKLEILDLSHNYISTFEIDTSAVAWDTPLLNVNLSYNNITRITVDFIEKLVKLPNLYLNLEGNPIDCTCSPEMEKVVDLVQDSGKWKTGVYERYENIRHLKCATPASAEGMPIISLTKSYMTCVMIPYAVIIILSIIVCLLLVTLVVMTRFRREIQILMYTRFNLTLPCQSPVTYQNKTYDAFVSYSNENDVWVIKTFQALEEEEHKNTGRHFRFCLHQRDFIAGKTIFDNIIESVESSHHTVIVLSKYFLQSHWCMYEFQEAFQQSIIERKRHLIVVLMEDIPEDDLPKELKRCLKTFTYIKKDDAIFHDRLIYALSFKGQKEKEINPADDEIGDIECYTNYALEQDDAPNVLENRHENCV